jgi:hypothetical protein
MKNSEETVGIILLLISRRVMHRIAFAVVRNLKRPVALGFSVALGFNLGGHIMNNYWEKRCIENNYAECDNETGDFVFFDRAGEYIKNKK